MEAILHGSLRENNFAPHKGVYFGPSLTVGFVKYKLQERLEHASSSVCTSVTDFKKNRLRLHLRLRRRFRIASSVEFWKNMKKFRKNLLCVVF